MPEHPIDTTLTLLRASARGVVVQQGAPSDHPPSGDYDSYLTRTFSGPEGADLRDARGISFSAGRGAVVTSHRDWSWHLLDRGKETGAIPATDHVKASGPYALSNGKVYGTEGNLVYTEPSTPGAGVVADNIFGPSIVYVVRLPAGRPHRGDLGQHRGLGRMQRVGGDGGEHRHPWPARHRLDGRSALRQGVVLGDGVLAWQDAIGTYVVDLSASQLVPVVLPGSAARLVLDGHWIARQLTNQHGYAIGYDIQALPFDPKQPPRLIGTAAPHGFTPDGVSRSGVLTGTIGGMTMMSLSIQTTVSSTSQTSSALRQRCRPRSE